MLTLGKVLKEAGLSKPEGVWKFRVKDFPTLKQDYARKARWEVYVHTPVIPPPPPPVAGNWS